MQKMGLPIRACQLISSTPILIGLTNFAVDTFNNNPSLERRLCNILSTCSSISLVKEYIVFIHYVISATPQTALNIKNSFV